MCLSVLVEHPVGVVKCRLGLLCLVVQRVVFGNEVLQFGRQDCAEVRLGLESQPESVDGDLVLRCIGSELLPFRGDGVQENCLGLKPLGQVVDFEAGTFTVFSNSSEVGSMLLCFGLGGVELTLQLGNTLLGVLKLALMCCRVGDGELLNLRLDLGKYLRQRVCCALEEAYILEQVPRSVESNIRMVGALRCTSNRGQGRCHLRRYLDTGSTSDLGSEHT